MQPLNLKYRPKTFDEFFGNKTVVNSLKTILSKEGKPTSILLTGPSGTGKSTLSRIIATELGANDFDIQELNISNARGIDSAREIIESVRISPFGKYKVIILNEIQNSTKDFQHCMLEVLEEPPKNCIFILCTTEPEKLLPTIKNRCTHFQTSLLTEKSMTDLLKKVLENEKAAEFPEEAVKQICIMSEGSPRKALVMLDSVMGLDKGKVLKSLSTYKDEEAKAIELCQALIHKKTWKILATILSNLKEEPETIRYIVLGYMASTLLKGSGSVLDRASLLIQLFSENFYDSKKAGLVNACYLSTLE